MYKRLFVALIIHILIYSVLANPLTPHFHLLIISKHPLKIKGCLVIKLKNYSVD